MAKNVNEKALKTRQTKLSKKSSEELVQIILRKDNIEKNLNGQIINLKGEVNSLSTRVNNFDADMEGTLQSLDAYKGRVETLNEKLNAANMECVDIRNAYNDTLKTNVAFKKQVKAWRNTSFALLGILIAIGTMFVILY